jgi:hypothetical protein
VIDIAGARKLTVSSVGKKQIVFLKKKKINNQHGSEAQLPGLKI